MSVVIRRNLAANPGPRVLLWTGWGYQTGTGGAGTTTWVSTPGDGAEGRTGFSRRTITAAKTGSSEGHFYRNTPGFVSGAAGDVITVSAWVRCSRASVWNASGVGFMGNAVQQGASTNGVQVPANTWTRIGVTFATAGDYDGFQIYVNNNVIGGLPVGTTVDVADILAEYSPVIQGYFDGSMNVAGSGVAWEGLANNSVSVMTTIEPDSLIRNRATRPPLRLEVFDKAFALKGAVGNPLHLTVIARHNEPGQISFALPSDHRLVGALTADGAHVRVVDEAAGHVLSGWVSSFTQRGPERSSIVDFNVTGHLAALRTILGWVIPGNAITAQGSAGTNWTMSGPAETVLKAALTQNGVTRLGLPIIVPSTLGRGATVSARLRMQSLYDRLFPVVDGAGIAASGVGFDLRLLPGRGLTLDTYVPRVIPAPLTELSGAVTDWSYSYAAPGLTRAVVGGSGEGTLRLWREYSVPALETSVGWKRETFRDARDTNDPTTMYARAAETVGEAGAKVGFSVSLAQVDRLRYGVGINVGDTISLQIGGRTLTDTLSEATLSWTKDKGYETRPRVGDKTDVADTKLIKILQSITRALQNRNTST